MIIGSIDLRSLDQESLDQLSAAVQKETEKRRAEAMRAGEGLHPDVQETLVAYAKNEGYRVALAEKAQRDKHDRLKDRVQRGQIDRNGWHLLNCTHCLDRLFNDDVSGMCWEGREDYRSFCR